LPRRDALAGAARSRSCESVLRSLATEYLTSSERIETLWF